MNYKYLDNLTKDMKDAISEQFDNTFNFDFLELVAEVISRLEVEKDKGEIVKDSCNFTHYRNLKELILAEMDNCFTYDWQQWEMMKYYQSPENANLSEALNKMANDIIGVINLYIENVKDNEDN